MKLIVLYQPRSEHARATEAYVRELQQLHPDKEVVLMDVDGIQGSQKAELYDAVRYPALLVISGENNSLVNSWTGETFPLMDEVVAYLR